MNEQPVFLQSGTEKLFAIIHRPQQGTVVGAYVFCHPFAEEKLWSHRVYVSFARELSKRGYLVIRFDMRGYGDSDGDFIDVSIDNHIADTTTVINHVTEQYPQIQHIGLFGLRLGGTIAALVAEQCQQISELIMWEPVVNGDRYMQEILRSNLAAQMSEKGKVEITREDLVNDMKSGRPVNIEGYPVTYKFFNGVSCLNLLNTDLTIQANCLINQVIRNVKQPFSKEMLQLQQIYTNCDLQKSDELQFWKEIKEFYFNAENLFATTLEWIENNDES